MSSSTSNPAPEPGSKPVCRFTPLNTNYYISQTLFDITTPPELKEALVRHFSGQWGDVSEEIRRANEKALVDTSSALISFHKSIDGFPFVIVTSRDRLLTSLMTQDSFLKATSV